MAVLYAGTGSFTFTGGSVRMGRRLAAGYGSFALTGQAVALNRVRKLDAGTGSFVLTMISSHQAAAVMPAGAGSFAVTGGDTFLDSGNFAGQPLSLITE